MGVRLVETTRTSPCVAMLTNALVQEAVARTRLAIHDSHVCIAMCVLLQRVLVRLDPSSTFTLRLGSLHVIPHPPRSGRILFDPRGPDGIDGGFHAWLEDTDGRVLDPSILQTLFEEGYAVDPLGYVIAAARVFDGFAMRFVYEELTTLELTGVDQSEPHLARLMIVVMEGRSQPAGNIYLDVVWKSAPT